MRRDLSALTARTYDVVVVGGGIFGACAAWDAVLRGLSVALVERDDFGGATSANSLKMVHGGIAISSMATSRGCASPAPSAARCCGSPPTSCSRCRS